MKHRIWSIVVICAAQMLTSCGSEDANSQMVARVAPAVETPAQTQEATAAKTEQPRKAFAKKATLQKPVEKSATRTSPEKKQPKQTTAKAVRKKAPVPKLNGRQVAERVESRPSYRQSESTALEMRLISGRGGERRREFLRYQLKSPSGKQTLMKFLLPRDIKDTGTLNQEVKRGNDTQYLYLPAAKKLRRISTENKSQAWVGSDFTFEDLQELELDDYHYELLGTEKIDGHECYKYSMTPVSADKSIYGKQIRWARVEGFLPVHWEYYDTRGRLLKTMHASDFRATNGIQYAWKIIAKNVQDNHRTELTRRWLRLDDGLDPAQVTTRQLERSINRYRHPKNLHELWEGTLDK